MRRNIEETLDPLVDIIVFWIISFCERLREATAVFLFLHLADRFNRSHL